MSVIIKRLKALWNFLYPLFSKSPYPSDSFDGNLEVGLEVGDTGDNFIPPKEKRVPLHIVFVVQSRKHVEELQKQILKLQILGSIGKTEIVCMKPEESLEDFISNLQILLKNLIFNENKRPRVFVGYFVSTFMKINSEEMKDCLWGARGEKVEKVIVRQILTDPTLAKFYEDNTLNLYNMPKRIAKREREKRLNNQTNDGNPHSTSSQKILS